MNEQSRFEFEKDPVFFFFFEIRIGSTQATFEPKGTDSVVFG